MAKHLTFLSNPSGTAGLRLDLPPEAAMAHATATTCTAFERDPHVLAGQNGLSADQPRHLGETDG